MFSEADAFLDAIFAQPADGTPRLVYADWLEEHGQPNYAQFIRLQCAAAREKPWSDEANRLWVEIGRVWNRLADEWWPAAADWWPGIPDASWIGGYGLDAVHFSRGFLRTSIAVSSDQLIRYWTCWPWLPAPVCTLRLNLDIQTVDILHGSQALRRLRHVRCEVGEGNDPVPASVALDDFLRAPHLCNLRSLDLSRITLEPTSADILLTAPNLGTVQELVVFVDAQSNGDTEAAILQLRGRFPQVFRR